MMDLANDDYYVVVDMGTSTIRGAVGMKDLDGNVDVLCSEHCPSRGVKRGAIVNLEAAAGCVREIVTLLQNRMNIIINKNKSDDEKRKYVIEKLYVGLNGQSIRTLENHVLRNLGKEEVEITSEILNTLFEENKNVKIDDGEILDVVAQEFNIDDEDEISPVGYLGTRIEGRYKIICGRPSLKMNIFHCMQRAGYEVAGYLLSPVAASNTVLSDEEKKLGCALIDFGAGTTSVVVYHKGILRHLAVIPFGSDVISKDIMDLKVVDNVAEKLKVKYGSAMEAMIKNFEINVPMLAGKSRMVNSRFLSSIIEARIDEILDCIWKQLEKSHLTSYINEVVITGNGANLKNLKDKMELRTGVDVRAGVPTWNTVEGLDEKFKTVEYGLLIGLLNASETICVNSSVDTMTEATVSKPEKKRVKKDSEDSGQGSLWGVFSKVKQKYGNFMDDLLDDKNI